MAEGHRQRLRDRFLRYGLDSFTDEEVIELLLALGTPRKDCKTQARAAYKKFGSLARVLEADIDELKTIKGIGPKNAFAIKFIHQVARRFLRERLREPRGVKCAKDVVDYLCHTLSFRDREVFCVLFLNSRNQILDIDELFSGTANEAPVYPREVMRQALLKNATSIILAHNHPSGSKSPSKSDIELTKRLKKAGELLNIKVLDHIIISGPSSYLSFVEEGLIK